MDPQVKTKKHYLSSNIYFLESTKDEILRLMANPSPDKIFFLLGHQLISLAIAHFPGESWINHIKAGFSLTLLFDL
jgi:hypothetical protein